MSEYQYYEFQAMDRPLTEQERAEIRQLSSRVQPTATQAVFTYSFGDFHGNPLQVLEKYFDAMLYLANWGQKRLAFRFPRAAVRPEMFEPYEVTDAVTTRVTTNHVLWEIETHEGNLGWIEEAPDDLSSMILLRADLLRGDERVLYLAWLKAVTMGPNEYYTREVEEEDPLEPPVPPNLGQISGPLASFIQFFELDRDLVAAAAEVSPSRPAIPATELERWIPRVPEDERLLFLRQLARGEPGVAALFQRRLQELALRERDSQVEAMAQRRRLSELQAAAATVRQRREAQERRAAEEQRRQKLQELARRESQVWEQVFTLIQQMQARPYEEAVQLLTDLRDLAASRNQMAQFQARIREIRERYSSRSGLMRRMDKAGLI